MDISVDVIPPDEPKYTLTLTLSKSEARDLMRALGYHSVQYGHVCVPVRNALYHKGIREEQDDR